MNIDRRFLKVRFLIEGVADKPKEVAYGLANQYIVGSNPSGSFRDASPNDIAYLDFEKNKWIFIKPNNELEVFNLETKEFMIFAVDRWIERESFKKLNIKPCEFYVELTQKDIDNKSVSLGLLWDDSLYPHSYTYMALFLNGVLQLKDRDFSLIISNNIASISWANGFNDLDIRVGDIITLQLMATLIN